MASVSTQPSNRKPFYGWVIVATCFWQLMFSAGLGFYGLPVYLKTLNKQRGFSVFSLSIATALFWVAVGVTGVVVARLMANIDPRFIIAVGGAFASVSIFFIGRATQLWQITFLYMCFGAGFTGTAVLVANTLVTRWFHRKRSIALSISATGLSVGGIVVTPIAKRLLDDHPIRDAMALIALLFFAGTVLLSGLLLRSYPAKKGQFPDGDVQPKSPDGATPSIPGMSFSHAVSTAAFWAITTTFALSLLGQVGGISQIVKLASERADETTSTQVISVLAACSVLGRLSGGVIVTKVNSRMFAYGALAIQASGLAVLSFAHSRASIFVGAAMFGLGVGNVLLLHPLLLAEAFGVKEYGRVYGRSSIFISMGNAVGPFAMGFFRDHAGGYSVAYLFAAALNLVGLAVYIVRGQPPTDTEMHTS